jgi:hypothetical protein
LYLISLRIHQSNPKTGGFIKMLSHTGKTLQILYQFFFSLLQGIKALPSTHAPPKGNTKRLERYRMVTIKAKADEDGVTNSPSSCLGGREFYCDQWGREWEIFAMLAHG